MTLHSSERAHRHRSSLIGIAVAFLRGRRFLTGYRVAIAMLWTGLLANAASFEVQLQNSAIELGDSTILSLQFQDLKPDGAVQLPELNGATVRYVGPAHSFSLVNGKRSVTATYRYQITPREPGELVIPAMSVE